MGSVRFSVTNIFLRQFKELTERGEGSRAVYQEVQFLLEALAEYGHDIESHDHFAASKPLLGSRPWAVFTLRRTPPTIYTPNATGEPVLRVPYLWFRDTDTGDEIAVVLFITDKSDCEDQDEWYEQLAEQVTTVANQWRKDHPTHRPLSIHAIGKAKDS